MRTLIAVCLDESGSMAEGGKRAAAIGAFNEYLADQKRLTADECLMSLTKFNTTSHVKYPMMAVAHMPALSHETYNPGGGTALLDAVADTIQDVERHIRYTPSKACEMCGTWRPGKIDDRVVVVILTDGEENSSRRFTLSQLKQMIEGRQGTGHWTFVYLSAGLNAFHDGASLGIFAANTVRFANSAAGYQNAVYTVSTGTSNLRQSSATMSRAYFTGTDAETAADENAPTPAGTGG